MSISPSMRPSTCSSRCRTLAISSTFCFSESFSVICAATVSASRPGESMPDSEVENLGRNLLVELDVLLEARHHGARQHVHLAAILLAAFGQLLGFGGEAVGQREIAQPRAPDALDEHLDRAVRQLQELQDRRERADLVDVLRARLVDVGLRLRDEQDLAIARPSLDPAPRRTARGRRTAGSPCADTRRRRATAGSGVGGRSEFRCYLSLISFS